MSGFGKVITDPAVSASFPKEADVERLAIEIEGDPLPSNFPVGQFNLSDAGNGELLAKLYGDRWRHDYSRNRDLLYNKDRWEPEATAALMQMAKEAARQRYLNAINIPDSNERSCTSKWAIQSEAKARLDAAISLARTEPPVADAGEYWDSRPMLLAVGNGVIDLETGKLRTGKPEDRLILHTPVLFDAAATCPRFEQFIREIFKGDPDLIYFVMCSLGYSITGLTIEQILFILYGLGANGKSVLLSILREVLGQLSYNMPFSTLEMKDRASIPNDLAALADKRFVTASETNEQSRLNEARIKALTGGDPITARFLHGEFFTFKPAAKFWLAVNHKPRVTDDSYGFWRRVRLIPFTQQFAGEKVDPGLERKLLTELPGILNWVIRGCLEYQKQGLKPPANVLAATEEYRKESDPLDQFIEERCTVGEGLTAAGQVLYKAYRTWAEAEGHQPKEILTSTAFGRRIGDGFKGQKTRNGKVYHGVKLDG